MMKNFLLILTISFLLLPSSYGQFKFKDEQTWRAAYELIELSQKGKCEEAFKLFEELSADTVFLHVKSYISLGNCLQQQGKEEEASKFIDEAVSQGILKRSVPIDSISHPELATRFHLMLLEDQGAWSLKDKFIIDPEAKEGLIRYGIKLDELIPMVRRGPGRELHKMHTEELIKAIDEYGFPTEEMVGVYALKGVKLVILHSKLEMLEKYAEEYKKTFGPKMYAYHTDKRRVAKGLDQLYGTQGDFNEYKKLVFYPIEDEVNVNKRRMEADMEPLELYAKLLGVENYQVPIETEK